MNKLQELFKTKKQIEAEIQKENQKKAEAETKARRDKLEVEERQREKAIDEMKFSQVSESVKEIKARLGEDIDLDKVIFIFATFLYTNRQNIDMRQFYFDMESVGRTFNK